MLGHRTASANRARDTHPRPWGRACAYPQLDGVPTIKLPSRSAIELHGEIASIRSGGRHGALAWLDAWYRTYGLQLDRLGGIVRSNEGNPPFVDDWREFTGDPGHYFL